MIQASHLISPAVSGHGPSDGRSQRLSMVSPCPSCNDHIKFPQVKLLQSRYTSKPPISFICNANSSGQRRNPDFSRQNRQGYSRNKNRNTEDRDSNSIDGFEDSEPFISKNGPSFLSGSGSGSNSNSPPSPKFHSAATPGPREREIVEIFRKVQAQLRERAAQKEEKKVEDSQSQGHNKQNETVDSLLKLLRKHSVQHGKTTTNNRNNRDFVLDNQTDHSNNNNNNNSFSEDIRTLKDSNSEIQSFRPASNFQRRSPVPRFKYKPILSGQEMEEEVKKVDPVPEVKMETGSEPEVENEVFSGFDESSDDEASDIEDAADEIDEIDEAEEVNVIEDNDLSNMKLVELRALAKSRGIKGMSRLKKQELLELLSS